VSGGFEKGNSAKLNYFLNAKVILLIIDFMLSRVFRMNILFKKDAPLIVIFMEQGHFCS